MNADMRVLRRIFFCLVPIQVVVLTFFLIQVARRHASCSSPSPVNISCHFLRSPVHVAPFEGPEGEDGQTLKKENLSKRFLPNGLLNKKFNKNIYFHETSCRGALTVQQACVVESACSLHPDWTVYVLFSAPIKLASIVDFYNICPNIKFRRLYIEDHVKGTPIEYLLKSRRFNRNLCTYSQAADMLRYATLFKYPGVYLDLDMLVTRRLYRLGENYAVREDDLGVSPGVLDFSDDDVGRSVAKEVAEELATIFKHKKRANGADAITRVFNRRCNQTLPRDIQQCKGFKVYRVALPVPVGKRDFKIGGLEKYHLETFLFHLNQQHDRCISSSTDEVYSWLASLHCPNVYQRNSEEFATTEI